MPQPRLLVGFLSTCALLTPWVAAQVAQPALQQVSDDEQATACQPSWVPTFGSSLDKGVEALAVFDDGSGPALYAAGSFTVAGDSAAKWIAKWDGTNWSALGSGVNNQIYALAVFDDGSGPALYAGGDLTMAGGVAVSNIAKWDGANWSALGSGTDQVVKALAVFDDGSGPALYAGGFFTIAGGVAASHLAKWDGTTWSALASELNNDVLKLLVFDDGNGSALYAAGQFDDRIAKWDGTSWSALGSGVNNQVWALAAFDDGGGPALYAGGLFGVAGGNLVNKIAKWDGTHWSALGSGLNEVVTALAVFDDGSGPALYAGGHFTTAGGGAARGIARWNGSEWSMPGNGLHGVFAFPPIVNALTSVDIGTDQALYAGGWFVAIDSGDTHLARWGCPGMPSPWTNLGFAHPGKYGEPLLVGTGPLTTGSAGTLTLYDAASAALALRFTALSSTPTPFKCGTLVPVPFLGAPVALSTSWGGELPSGWSSLPAGLSGLSVYFQFAIKDSAALCGVAFSNALRADMQ
jgi:hypothetical protein